MTWDGRLKFYVSSADPDAVTPVWVEFTARVMDQLSPLETRFGRTTELDDTEPGTLQLILNNADDALTFGNTSSPYTSWWGPGRKCWLTERVTSAVTQDRFTGYIQMPEEFVATEGIEQRVMVTAVDRLGRLDQARPFISTVAAHVLGSVRNASLLYYWPLLDQAGDLVDVVGTVPLTPSISGRAAGTTSSAADQLAAVLYQGAPTLPGDDVPSVRLVPGVVAGQVAAITSASANIVLHSLSSGQVATLAGYLNLESYGIVTGNALRMNLQSNGTGSGAADIAIVSDSIGQHFRLNLSGTVTGTIDSPDGSANATGRWYALGARVGFGPDVFELWVDTNVYPGTMSASPTGLGTFGALVSPFGSAAHMQVYTAAATDFTNADFLAQRTVALYGLGRQTTGQRVASILGYAGVPSAEYATTVDTGTAVMQPATLAGQDPLTALQDAVRTEQGLIYVDGSGNTHFADRRTLYGI